MFNELKTDKVIAGRYKLKPGKNAGSFGMIYTGYEQKKEGRAVAIKQARIPAGVKTLQREARLLARLSHSALPRIYEEGLETGLDNVGPVVVMEWLPGKTLSEWKKEELDWREILTIARQAASALAYLTDQNIVHFDINPSNFLYDREEVRLGLVDFGLAASFKPGQGGIRQKVEADRRPDYLPPEARAAQESGKTLLVTPAVDVYGLGMILAELMQAASGGQDSDSEPAIPAEFGVLIKDMGAARPENRPDAEEVLRRLEEIAQREREHDNRSQQPFEDLPLVGREADRATLQEWLVESRAGRKSGVAIITGTTGVGKSRLMSLVEGQARQQFGFSTVTASAFENDLDVRPYAPLGRLVQSCLGQTGADDDESLLDEAEWKRLHYLLPELAGGETTIGSSQGSGSSQPGGERSEQKIKEAQEQLAALLVRLWQKMAERQPLLVRLEDVHFADDALLAVLKRVQDRFNRATDQYPVLLWLTFRTSTTQSEERLADFFGEPDLTLLPLGVPEIEELLVGVGLERDALGYLPELARSLFQYTGGQPLLLKEELLLLRARGLIKEKSEGGWRLSLDIKAHELALDLDRRATRSTAARLQLLGPNEQKVVRIAALLGFKVETDLLAYVVAGVARLSRPQLEEALARLVYENILVGADNADGDRGQPVSNSYHFSHDLLYQAARRTTLGNIRKIKVAEQVDEYYGLTLQDPASGLTVAAGQLPFALAESGDETVTRVLPLLAYCYQDSRSYRAECGYSLLAGEQALNASANIIARHHYKATLARLEEVRNSTPDDCDENDAPFVENHDWQTQTAFFAHRGLSWAYHNNGLYEETITNCEKAIKLVEKQPALVGEDKVAEIYGRWVTALYMLSRYPEAIELVTSSGVTSLTTPGALDTLVSYAVALHRMGKISETQRIAQQILWQAQESKAVSSQIRSCNLLAVIEFSWGNFEAVINYGNKALALAEVENNFDGQDKACSMLMQGYWNLGDKEKVYYYTSRNLHAVVSGKITSPDRVCNAYNQMGIYHMVMTRRLEEAANYFTQSLNVALQANLIEEQGLLQMNLGYLYLDLGSESELPLAKTYFDRARVIFESGLNRTNYPILYKNYGTYFLKNKQMEEAKEYFELALQWASRRNNWFEFGDTSSKLASLYRVENNISLVQYYLIQSGLAWRKLKNWNKLKEVTNWLGELYLAQNVQKTLTSQSERQRRRINRWQHLVERKG